MKIHNKKTFIFGVFSLLLAALNIITFIMNKTFNIGWIVIIIVLLFTGTFSVIRDTAKKFADEDKLEAEDERNKFIDMKSKSKAFSITQILSFALMIIIFACGKIFDYNGFIYIGLGIAFVLSISMFSEMFSFLHYESKY